MTAYTVLFGMKSLSLLAATFVKLKIISIAFNNGSVTKDLFK